MSRDTVIAGGDAICGYELGLYRLKVVFRT